MFETHRFQDWITKTLNNLPSPDVFRLRHEGGEVVQTFTIDHDNIDIVATTIAEEVMLSARSHADSFDRAQRYALVGFQDEEEIAQIAFRQAPSHGDVVTAEIVPAAAEPRDENPELVGILTRHLESREKQFVSLMDSVVGHLASENASLRRSRERHDEMRFEYFTKTEELLNEQHLRDMERDEFDRKEALKEKAIERVMQFAPAVVGHMLKKGSLPKATSKPAEEKAGPTAADFEATINETVASYENEPPEMSQLLAGAYSIVLKIGGYRQIRTELQAQELIDDLDAIVGMIDPPTDVGAFRQAAYRVVSALSEETILAAAGKLTEEESRLLTFVMSPAIHTPEEDPTP